MTEDVVELRVLREQVERKDDAPCCHRSDEQLEGCEPVRQHEADDLAGRDPPRGERGLELGGALCKRRVGQRLVTTGRNRERRVTGGSRLDQLGERRRGDVHAP